MPLFKAAALLRRAAYDAGLLAVARPPVFTVSVGGLEAGGSGKTPVAALLLRAFLDAGRQPGLATRGYGRATSGLVTRQIGAPASPQSIGDEPAMLVASGLDVPVAAAAKRRLAADALASAGCDAIVLDDGFQHRALGRDVDVVVLRGEAPFGSGHLLPWGTLREPPSSLRRAHVVWLHYRGAASSEPPPWLARHAPQALFVASEAELGAVRDLSGATLELAGRRVVGAAGIARPGDFESSLRRTGANVVRFHAFADHHPFTRDDVRRLAGDGADCVAVTAKDAVKLAPLWQGPPLVVVGTRVVVRHGGAALGARLGLPSAF